MTIVGGSLDPDRRPVIALGDAGRRLVSALGLDGQAVLSVDVHFRAGELITATATIALDAGQVERIFELVERGEWRESD